VHQSRSHLDYFPGSNSWNSLPQPAWICRLLHRLNRDPLDQDSLNQDPLNQDPLNQDRQRAGSAGPWGRGTW
jgi:hypothetical protein